VRKVKTIYTSGDLISRTKKRVAFGKPIAAQGKIQSDISKSRMAIDQARLLTLKTAYMMDTVGNKVARTEIAMIKVVVPNMAQVRYLIKYQCSFA
jgi:alkylation response protein AidB-like acyl-CoA dehydrogenase